MAALLDVTLPGYQQEVIQKHFNLKKAHTIFRNKYGSEKGSKVYEEFLAFRSCQDPFKDIFFPNPPEKSGLTALQWWAEQFAGGDLSKYAQQLLSIIPSSGASEQVWSTFGYLHSKSRNRLKNERVEKLVYIYTNDRLLDNHDYRPEWFTQEEVPMEGEDEDSLDLSNSAAPLAPISEDPLVN